MRRSMAASSCLALWKSPVHSMAVPRAAWRMAASALNRSSATTICAGARRELADSQMAVVLVPSWSQETVPGAVAEWEAMGWPCRSALLKRMATAHELYRCEGLDFQFYRSRPG